MRDGYASENKFITKALARAKAEGIPSRDEELALAKRIRDGDESAAQELAERNAKYAAKMANKYAGRGVPLEDLFNAAMVGMMRGAYDFAKQDKWHYLWQAHYTVQQELCRANQKEAGAVVIPMNVLRAIVADARGSKHDVSEDRLSIGRAARNVLSTDGDPEVDFDCTRHAWDGESLEGDIEARDYRDFLWRLMVAYLGEWRAELVLDYCGLGDTRPGTIELSEKHGLSKQRVHQIWQECQEILQRAIPANEGRATLQMIAKGAA